jgi:hypothetical protein
MDHSTEEVGNEESRQLAIKKEEKIMNVEY